MIDMTYEDALKLIDELIHKLEKNKTITINNRHECYLISDALSLLESKLEEDLYYSNVNKIINEKNKDK